MEFSYRLGINLGLMTSSGVMKSSERDRFKPAAVLTAGDQREMPPAHRRGQEGPALSSPSTNPVCWGLV